MVTGTVSDPGWLDPLTATISWGDGSPAGPLSGTLENVRPDATLTFSATHTYGDNGTYTVEVCARDDDSAPVCQSTSVQIDNVAPTAAIDLSGATIVNGVPTLILHAGDDLSLTGQSTDPGSDDLTLAWDWGDGTPVVSTPYLVNPPTPDPAQSPSIQPRDVTESQVHAYASACTYVIGFTSTDDDAGTSTTTANAIILGNGEGRADAAYWRAQFRSHLQPSPRGAPLFDAATLTCYLKIVDYMSAVFNEVTAAGTFAEAFDVLETPTRPAAAEALDQQLLVAWLGFAHGLIEPDKLFDLDGDRVPETPFLDVMAAAEAARLNPATTAAALRNWATIVATLR
jgi:hypothetical protein